VGLLEKTVLTLPRGKKKHLVTEVEVNAELVAPLAVGDAVGTVTLTLDGETVFHAPVVALVAVEPGGFFARLWDMILMWIASLFST
jgi:D-alanyl-D-alanine carboxypeptidase (penicillin-binding protein 5/6)